MHEARVMCPINISDSSKVILIKKKNGDVFSMDNMLNNAIKRYTYPVQHIKDLLNCFLSMVILPTLDFTLGHFKIHILEEPIKKKDFACPDGLFEFNELLLS